MTDKLWGDFEEVIGVVDDPDFKAATWGRVVRVVADSGTVGPGVLQLFPPVEERPDPDPDFRLELDLVAFAVGSVFGAVAMFLVVLVAAFLGGP